MPRRPSTSFWYMTNLRQVSKEWRERGRPNQRFLLFDLGDEVDFFAEPDCLSVADSGKADSITIRGTRLSKTSVNRELEILSKIFTKAKDFGKVDRNPCRQVERFKNRKVIPRYFTHDEEDRLMAAMTGTLAHLRPIATVGIGTGLRPPSEIFNLRRSDVDFERNVLRAGTKTDEEREIPMSETVREVLFELYNRNTGSEFLFVSWRTGDRFKEVKNGFRWALKEWGSKARDSTPCGTLSAYGWERRGTRLMRSWR